MLSGWARQAAALVVGEYPREAVSGPGRSRQNLAGRTQEVSLTKVEEIPGGSPGRGRGVAS